MSEKQFLSEIGRIGWTKKDAESAIAEIKALFSSELGETVVLVRNPRAGESLFKDASIAAFLDKPFPVRSVYTSRVAVGERNPAILAVCVGSDCTLGPFLQQAVDLAAIQLAIVLSRSRGDLPVQVEAA